MNDNTILNPTRRAAPETATVQWIDTAGAPRTAPASRALLREELYLAPTIRRGHRYPRQRNYHGLYYVSQTGRHAWFESHLEKSRLAWLDLTESIAALATQPMQLTFGDGTTHVPDFLVLHGNGRQAVYDVKPARKIKDEVAEQFEKTRALCEHVGWGYGVLSELPATERANLDWLSMFKHPGFHPGADTARPLFELLAAGPAPVLDAATVLQPTNLPEGRSAVFHLLWNQELTTDLSVRISDRSLVEVAR